MIRKNLTSCHTLKLVISWASICFISTIKLKWKICKLGSYKPKKISDFIKIMWKSTEALEYSPSCLSWGSLSVSRTWENKTGRKADKALLTQQCRKEAGSKQHILIRQALHTIPLEKQIPHIEETVIKSCWMTRCKIGKASERKMRRIRSTSILFLRGNTET